MKLVTILFLLFFSLQFSAQNSSEMITDIVIKYQASTLLYEGKNKTDVESYYVLKNASESYFLSESMFKLDSLQKVKAINKNNLSKIKLKRPLFIAKSNGNIRHYENIGNNYTVYSEQLTLGWKLESGQKKD